MRKKCPLCKIVFYNASRLRCLYCDTILAALSDDEPVDDAVAFLSEGDDPVVLSTDTNPLGEAVRDLNTISSSEADRITERYFRTRSFGFFYKLNRHELLMGHTFKRFFIQPLDPSFFLRIPYLALDVVESLLIHLTYRHFCPVCRWKYAGIDDKHDPKECAYNREYTLLINAILTGFIARLEPTFAAQSEAEVKRGQRSAYRDLCVGKSQYETVLDHICMWFSGALLLAAAWLVLEPLIKQLIVFLGIYERVEIFK